MLPNVTQSFKSQKPDLQSFMAEAMLRLFIAEHYSTVWKHATIWKRSSRTACHTKNEVSCSYIAQKVKMLTDRGFWAETCVGQDRHFQPMLVESECKTKNWYIV